jgi:hypothetical protein
MGSLKYFKDRTGKSHRWVIEGALKIQRGSAVDQMKQFSDWFHTQKYATWSGADRISGLDYLVEELEEAKDFN